MNARSGFVHLHNHLEGSHSDSVLRTSAALDKAVADGMTAFAVTDHGELAAVPALFREAAARGIKPIAGMEAYFAEDAAANIRDRVNDRYHLVLLAADAEGWRNLVRLATVSWRDNCLMQKLGLVDWKLLEECHRGLICLSACLAGPLSWPIVKGRPADAERMAARFRDIFGDRFYVELFEHGMPEEREAVEGMRSLARRLALPTVVTNDCHYLEREDWILQDTLIKTRFGKATEFELPYHEYFLKTSAEMRSLGFLDEDLDRTLEIAERISLTVSEWESLTGNGPVETAFLGRSRPLEIRKALEKAAGALRLDAADQERARKAPLAEMESSHPRVFHVAQGITGMPMKPEPDLTLVVSAPGLSSLIPLRRSEKILFTMWDEETCRRHGAEIVPVETAPGLLPFARATELYLKGLEAHRRRKFDKARSLLRQSLEADPFFTNALYQLGLSTFYAGFHDEAMALLERVLEQEPHFERLPHLYSYLGWCHYHLGQDERGLECFRLSTGAKPVPGSLLGQGLLLERLGRDEEARACLLEMVERAPADPKIEMAHAALERLSRRAPAPPAKP